MRTSTAHWLSTLLVALFLASTGTVAAQSLALPADAETIADGRLPMQDLYRAYISLRERGWLLEVVAESQPAGQPWPLPIIALRTPQQGPAVWILAGIHGEEPAGPNAIAATIEDIAALGEQRPVVLLPLNNPQGYLRSWRYLNVPTWSPDVDGHSVGDSSHLLVDPEQPASARAEAASSPEAEAITTWILQTARTYPPSHSIDLHEDSLISEGYVYSQGRLGAADPLALLAVQALLENGIPLKLDGSTRFDEPISGGIIGPVQDSSIDELMSASEVVVNGTLAAGPAAGTVLVFETPASDFQLQRRVQAHAALLRALTHALMQ